MKQLDEERSKIRDLEREVEVLIDDKRQVELRNKEIRETYAVLEEKLKCTEGLLDHRLHMIDSQD